MKGRVLPLLAALCLWAAGATAQTVPATPDNGGPRHFTVTAASSLNMRQERSTSAPVVARLAPGTILTNLGCEAAMDRIWCYVQPFPSGPVGFVDAGFIAPATAPDGDYVVTGPDDSALRAGQGDFDATGPIPCAMAPGQPMGQCQFGVARAGGGDATLIVTKPDGMKRAIFFIRGMAIGTDSAEADPASFRFSAARDADLTTVRIGDERYEIPDAAVFGG